jgi:uncharacterized protein YifE (UPF0438 family)
MAVSKEHQAFLLQRDFIPSGPAVFSTKEQMILARYGRWMEALATGVIAPATPEQQHFVQAARGEVVPRTRFEQIWVKVKQYSPPSAQTSPVNQGRQVSSPDSVQTSQDGLEDKLHHLAEAKRNLAAITELIEGKKKEVLKRVEADLAEIDALFSGRLEEAKQVVSEFEAEVKSSVLRAAHSVQAHGVQAIYYRSRVTWDSKALTQYAESHPEIEEFRKVGTASVSLRYRFL